MAPFGGSQLTPEEVAALETRAGKEGWLHVRLVEFDQFLNGMFFNGMPDETMSSHFQRMADAGNPFGKAMIAWLDVLQSRHGQKAQAGDDARAKAVEATEEQYLHPMSEAVQSSTDVLNPPEGNAEKPDLSQA